MNDRKVDFFMPLYIGDYLADTSHLGHEEHGVYLLLLMAAWKRGGRIPNDHQQLARMSCCPQRKWLRIWGIIARFFEVDGSDLVQRRVSRELGRAQKTRDGRVAGGRASAKSRRQKDGSAQPESDPHHGSPEPKLVTEPSEFRHQSWSVNPPFTDNEISAKSAESHTPPRTELPTRSEQPQPQPYPQQQPAAERTQSSRAPAPVSPLRSGSPGTGLAPPRPARGNYRPAHVGAVTGAFLDIYDAYPNKAGKVSASQVWQDVAGAFTGGEVALRDAITAQFSLGMLRVHPYNSEARWVPSLERFLRERRWEDAWRSKPAGEGFVRSDMPEGA